MPHANFEERMPNESIMQRTVDMSLMPPILLVVAVEYTANTALELHLARRWDD
jgi:hypothetical protein